MKSFYITTSIIYTNAPPHIGFALESVQADVLARYHRLLGEDVFFSTGTDEHGAKVAKAAEKQGKDPKEFVDKIAKKTKKLKEALNLSNDDFIRTTDQERHWPVARKIWEKLEEKGDIYKKKYQGLYCTGCEAFITKKDLIEGKCAIHKKEPEKVEEENYFFRLSKYSEEIEKAIKRDDLRIVPETRKNEALGFLNQGLEDISFSRPSKDLKWGIPVPGDPSQVLYVWADALSNYISVIGYGSEKFEKYWPADVHCIGKDILKFHALFWPGMLISLGLDLPKTIFVHGFLSVGGQKMSKSLGNVIDPFELVEKYGTDPVRYYLLREIPSTEDGDFTYRKFESRYNADLASGIGNLLARVRTMAEKQGFEESREIDGEIEKAQKECRKALEDFNFSKALESIWKLISYCDKTIEKEKPWEGGSEKVLGGLLKALDAIADLLEPFLPETSERIKHQLTRNKEGFKNKKEGSLFPRVP